MFSHKKYDHQCVHIDDGKFTTFPTSFSKLFILGGLTTNMEQLLKTDILYLVLVLLFKLDDYSRVNIKKETDSS